jgi:predicted RNA-binding Zn-ribbon protein involved in translation (DUF1610 family)
MFLSNIEVFGRRFLMAETLCPDCGSEMEINDTTYSNYDSPRAQKGEKTGDIYRCDKCECSWLENYLNDCKLEKWSY